jgi:transposase-like protein
MRNREMKRMLVEATKLTPAQRAVLQQALREQGDGERAVEVVQARLRASPTCPHCQGKRIVRNGQASGMQRFKCRDCAKTFNALTCTPLAGLRHKAKWLSQAEVLREGLSVHKAAERLQVAPSTAFRWRHRFLKLPQDIKAPALLGVVEADETYFLRSRKGQQVTGRAKRRRGGSAAKRGLSDEQVPVLVARDRAGATTDFIMEVADKAHELAALAPVLPSDAVLCTDGGGALAAVARHLGIEHHVLNMSTGPRVQGPWHIQNVNAYHGRLKQWMRRFNGVATSYLASYLGWFRACDRSAQTPRQGPSMLALALGA